LEPGLEKIAIFAKGGRPTHAARQLGSGRWTSKLGRAEDIEHDLRALEGEAYGAVAFFLQRPRATGRANGQHVRGRGVQAELAGWEALTSVNNQTEPHAVSK
jgi:hypothetical protein